jgi:hypothetical protein
MSTGSKVRTKSDVCCMVATTDKRSARVSSFLRTGESPILASFAGAYQFGAGAVKESGFGAGLEFLTFSGSRGRQRKDQ